MFFSALDPLARECATALNYAANGDLDAARSAIDKTRYLRSLVEWQKDTTKDNAWRLFGEEAQVDELYGSYADIAMQANQMLEIIYEWLRGSCEGFSLDELQASSQGLNLWLDTALPQIWDFTQDVVVLFGDEGPQLIPLLARRGQLNLVWLNDQIEEELIEYPGEGGSDILCGNTSRVLVVNPGAESKIDDYGALVGSAPPRFCLLSFHADNEKTSAFHKVVRSIATKAIGVNSVKTLATLITEQWIGNLPELSKLPSVVSLSNLFSAADILIASPGPSLEDSLLDLSNCRNRFVIVAPIRSLPALHQAGITADFAIWADPHDFSELLPTPEVAAGTSLLISESAHSNMFSGVFDRIFTIPEPALGKNLISQIAHGADAPAMPGGSVSVVAAVLAAQLKAGSITLIGQDLSYSDKRYSENSARLAVSKSPEHRKKPKQNKLSCKAIGGGAVPTKADYLHFIGEFERLARAFGSVVKLINSTASGALLEGWNHIPLHQNPVVSSGSTNISKGKNQKFDKIPEIKEDLHWGEAFDGTSEQLGRAMDICENLINETLRLIRDESKDVRSLESLEKSLQALMDDECGILKFYTSSNSITVRSASFSVTTLEDNLKLSCDYYRSIFAAAKHLRNTLDAIKLKRKVGV